MNHPFISIITTTKNPGNGVENTLKSVAKQENNSFEHIIIDSNSTDNSLEIVKRYEKIYPLKYISEADSGIAEAFNKGINLASGKWLIFLGSGDELISKQLFSEIRTELEVRDKELIVWGNIIYKHQDGRFGKKVKGDFPMNRLKRYMCLPHQAAFHNRLLFDRHGLFNEKIKVAMDYDMCLSIFDMISSNGYIDKDISYMLVGGQSMDYKIALKDFMKVQKRNNIWSFGLTPELLWLWGHMKYIIKKVIRYK